jgi:hypothetical protein
MSLQVSQRASAQPGDGPPCHVVAGDVAYLSEKLPVLGSFPTVDDLQQLFGQPVMLPSKCATQGCLHIASSATSRLAMLVDFVAAEQSFYISALVSHLVHHFVAWRVVGIFTRLPLGDRQGGSPW